MAVGTLPPELFAQQQQLNRQQQMAQLLMQQGQQQPQGQMVSGRYVAPSFFQNVLPLAQMYAGTRMAEKGDKKALDLAAALRKQYADELTKYQDLANPRQTEMAGPTITNAPLMSNAPDRQAANLFAASAYNPALQAVGMKNLTQGPKWEKASFTDEKTGKTREGVIDVNSPDPIGTFQVGGVKPEMSAYERASLQLKAGDQAISRANLQFNTGMTVGGGGVPMGAPTQAAPVQAAPTTYKTINQGSPILAPNQVVPQQNVTPQQQTMPNQPPRFNTKAEQDAWLAGEKKRTELRIEAQDKLPTALNTVNSGIKAIEGMIGDTTVDAKGNLVYGKTKPHVGFEAAVGMPTASSLFGLSSFFKGSDYKDFEARFKEIEGKSFLAAIDSLRGTGAISEVEGAKATAAINRMSLSQSEKEFVLAANELKDVMTKGYQAAQQRAGVKPFNPTAQPNVGGSKPAMPRYNLQTGEWE
jgi:hypothetical protein